MNHHTHNHAGHHHGHDINQQVLKVSLIVIASFMLVEIIAGFITGSLALLSDAGHMLSDALALGFSLLAFKLGKKASNHHQTFGYKRAEILFALLNGLTLIIIAVFIIIEAVTRFSNPPQVASQGMLVVSILGLLVNLIIAWYMHRHSDIEENLNMKSAYLHVLSDLLGSIGAIIAALCILFFDWRIADPLISIFVSLLIANSGFNVIKSTLHILMQGAPKHIDQSKLITEIQQVKGVENIHDFHLWTLTSQQHLLSAHIVVDGNMTVHQAQNIRQEIEHLLQHYGIHHATLQMESQEHGHNEQLHCKMHDNHNHHAHQH
ncbi:cation diffusion facilitator family transporter [Conservatibacter flavescens]|uniref:Uncharacterized protein n=1 Tax=Conservatibacter flavescens TaxID=28161 RepID=A0A2M8S1F6_9PAST|nr:cation diffusion facilitator family transporter [Conservatibacter flavescens]PJG84967.1 hypothetical protein CVP05_09035 [Conservatibacter flavescens]